MTYKKAEELYKTARNKNKGKPLYKNTRLWYNPTTKDYHIILYETTIIKIHKNYTYTLNAGNYFTNTIKNRINEYSPAFITKKLGNWYIKYVDNYFNNKELLFFNNIKVGKFGIPIIPDNTTTEVKQIKSIINKIDKII